MDAVVVGDVVAVVPQRRRVERQQPERGAPRGPSGNPASGQAAEVADAVAVAVAERADVQFVDDAGLVPERVLVRPSRQCLLPSFLFVASLPAGAPRSGAVSRAAKRLEEILESRSVRTRFRSAEDVGRANCGSSSTKLRGPATGTGPRSSRSCTWYGCRSSDVQFRRCGRSSQPRWRGAGPD